MTLSEARSKLGALDAHLRHDFSATSPPTWEQVLNRTRATEMVTAVDGVALDAALVANAGLDAVDNAWRDDVVEAFERLGYDETYGVNLRAGLHGLTQTFDQLDEQQLRGLTSSVKGTVLEIRVREMIDAGELPELAPPDVSAKLSDSLTQTGHDIEVHSATGELLHQVQVKAGSWSGLRPRIEEYAAQGIPVAVTSETAAAAEAAGFGDAVIDTGVSGADLTIEIGGLVENLGLAHAVDEFVPEIALMGLIAAAGLRLKRGQQPDEVKTWLVAELAERGVANAAGVAAQLLTGTVVLRPIAVLGARWGMGRKRSAAEACSSLAGARERLAARFIGSAACELA